MEMDDLGMMEGDLGVLEDDLGMMEDDLFNDGRCPGYNKKAPMVLSSL